MCRSASMRSFDSPDRDKLKIKAFCVRLKLSNSTKPCTKRLPESLTLVYLPRISGSPLDIDGCKIRPDASAFITLHRIVSTPSSGAFGELVFVSKESVRASEGVRYEVYMNETKLLKGVFRFRDDEVEEEWSVGCKCVMDEEEVVVGVQRVVAAEVVVAAEGFREAVCERVEMAVRRRRKTRRFEGLEEIPEEKEVEESEECCCCCGGEEEELTAEETTEETTEEELEGVGWAVDVGLWVMCLGVGLLVSKASSRRLRRRKVF